MIDKLLGVFLVLLQVIGFPCMAEVSLEEDFSFKVTLKQDVVDFDTTVSLSFSDDTFDFTSTWKADEDGFSSLKFVGKIEFTEDIDGRAEILFDEEKVKSLKLKVYDLPFSKILLDIQAYFKYKECFYLYEVSLDMDELTLAGLPASADLVFREEYLRAKLALNHKDDDLSLQGVWKKETLDEVKVTLDHDGENWTVKESLTFDPSSSLLYPEKGTLTLNGDIFDILSLKVACYHAFSMDGIEVDKLVSTVKLEVGEFDLTWKGTFLPTGANFSLGDYDLTLASDTEVNDLSLDTALKIDEDGFSSFSVKLSFSL